MEGDLTPEDFKWFEDRMPQYRREAIARTETIRASNAGALHQFDGWGARYKEWLATFDSRIRPAHADAGSRYAEGSTPGPIPMHEPFIVMGEPLQFPGDPSGSPGNTINCRCSIAPWAPEWAEIAPGATMPEGP